MTKIYNDEERSALAVARLRQSKDEQTRQVGRSMGRLWAMERATYYELERLVRSTRGDENKTLSAIVWALDDPDRSLFGQFGGLGPRSPGVLSRIGYMLFRKRYEGVPSQAYVVGWIEGATEFFMEVRDQI